MTWTEKQYDDDDQLTDALCASLCDCLEQALASKTTASLAVSGGTTPLTLFRKLAQSELDWGRVIITLVDERWLPPDHADSNTALVRQNLLQQRAASARFIPLTNEAPSAFLVESEIDAALDAIAWPLDASVLGMGEDGHTASLFPNAATLHQALSGLNSLGKPSRVCALQPPEANYERMTLTAPALLASGRLYLHIKGAKKRSVLERAMQVGPTEAMPIRFFLHQDEVDLRVFSSNQ